MSSKRARTGDGAPLSAGTRGVKFYGERDRKALQAMLRDKGFYSTEGRLQLLSYLKRSARPFSVKEVHVRLAAWLDEANVFRALEALTKAGVLTRSDMRGRGTWYEFRKDHHHHLICNSCGRTEDVDVCDDATLEKQTLKASRSFISIQTHALEFFGTCMSCAR